MPSNPNLKIILMSATLNSEKFSRYFNGCPIIDVPGRTFDVQTMHLEEVLIKTEYKMSKMATYLEENQVSQIRRIKDEDMPRSYRLICDSRLDSYILRKDCESFENVFSLIEGDYMPANYVHRTKQRTVLGIAAENGSLNMMLKLLAFGESATFKDPFGKSAIDYAKENKQEECCEGCELLMCYERVTSTTTWKNYVEIGRAYRSTQGTQNIIDHNLLFHVIDHIHENLSKNGAILVFLPSYDDICEQHEKLVSVHGLQDWGYKIFALHSELNDENNEGHAHVFDRMENGVRKIILSTNIAETALTIDDVVYVIDAGKAKSLFYDAETKSTILELKSISQACAKQRSGRAGRVQNGFCYRLYSLEQYKMMHKYKPAEIVRVPIAKTIFQILF
ncbi:ATP-dependent DNA/RNA helicase DHX36-like [Contarinia nasturtii]|uniref:ATP-dependent DNA/RNA helicase DHX36-like n=1 Tax=Contarinia nasturtii TaxID=265458 RepID=UPI0012D37789|nr:ATP-dependent DNA/RNA helicase DHX36-like [Contarinia nasturtii]XP_031618262.1 ATP-dependent DNA/RNA helicase DHX36-like [Contarinia nasturtii]